MARILARYGAIIALLAFAVLWSPDAALGNQEISGSANLFRFGVPTEVKVNPAGTEAWVIQEGSTSIGGITVFDTATNAQIAEIPIGQYVRDITFLPNGSVAYVSVDYGWIYAVNTSDHSIAQLVRSCERPQLDLDSAGTYLYIAATCGSATGILQRMSTETNVITDEILRWQFAPLPPFTDISLSPDGSRAYAVTSCCSSLVVLDTASFTDHSVNISPTAQASGVAVTTDGSVAVIAANPITLLDTTTESVIASISPSTAPRDVEVADARHAYVSERTSIDVIDLEHQVISHTINLGCTGLGDCYRGLGLTPNGQRGYVAGWYEHLVLFLSVDIDLDGLKTFEEDALGTSDKNADSDGDGLSDTAEVFVHGTNPTIPDTDEDGCSDGVELGPDQTLGGRRDPLNPNDYFNPSHDGKNRIDDILAVVRQYFDDAYLDPPTNTIPNPAYNPDTDRTPLGPNLWNLGPPNGLQRIPDILAMMAQYYHDCS